MNNIFGFVVNWGWRIVFFTAAIKLLLYPLDFLNRKKAKDNSRLMKKMKPELEKLEKKYEGQPQELMMAKRGLQKRYGYSMGMTCITTIITMIVFISLWRGLNSIATDMNRNIFNDLQGVYHQTFASFARCGDCECGDCCEECGSEDCDCEDCGIDADCEECNRRLSLVATENYNFTLSYIDSFIHTQRVTIGMRRRAEFSDEDIVRLRAEALTELELNVQGFVVPDFDNPDSMVEGVTIPYFTIENVWGDASMLPYFNSIRRHMAQQEVLEHYHNVIDPSFLWVRNIWRPDTNRNPIPSAAEQRSMAGDIVIDNTAYDNVMRAVVQENYRRWNGFFILVVLTVTLNFANQFVMMKMQKKTGEMQMQAPGMQGTMKVMMFIMPFMFGFFALQFAAAFTLYMVTNAVMSLVLILLSKLILDIRERKFYVIEEEEAAAGLGNKAMIDTDAEEEPKKLEGKKEEPKKLDVGKKEEPKKTESKDAKPTLKTPPNARKKQGNKRRK
jgi:YidC/Oxa1 family membrane protein insertase